MKTIVLATIAVVAAITVGRSVVTLSPTTTAADVFTGTSPCPDFAKPFLRIPAEVKCDRVKWQLTIRPDAKTYELTREYGFHVDNRTYQSHGSGTIEGTFAKTKGRANDPEATVFQLSRDGSQSISFAAIDQNVLHLLDTDKRLTVGNSGASYTISRIPAVATTTYAFTNQPPFNEGVVSAKALFSGRSPCHEIAKELKRSVAGDCFRLKWALELRRDPQTLLPTTYKLRGTLYSDAGSEHPREGTWKVMRGMRTNVYQLDAVGSEGPIYLLRADDGILFFLDHSGRLLVGDKDFSYTLNQSQ